MELVSQSALRVASLVWRPGHGGFAFTVVCKATFSLRPDESPLAPVQEVVVPADVPAADGSLVAASELVPLKKRPEVLVVGHAYAPEGRRVTSLVARVVVGEIDKAVQITGDRYFGLDGRLGEPAPFARMPLSWDRAGGGPGTSNPVGKAIGSSAQGDFFGRVNAPNLFEAGFFLTSRQDVVQPVGLGPIAPGWPSRAACLHRHAAQWDPARWNEQPLPADIDLGYFNAAPRDQQRATPFGDEQIYLENLNPTIPSFATHLARVTPSATVDLGAGPQPLSLRCDTLVLDTDQQLAMLIWRGHVLLDRWDRTGRVVVNGPGSPAADLPSWVHDVSMREREKTIVQEASAPVSRDLPFAGGTATPPGGIPRVSEFPPSAGGAPPSFNRGMTLPTPSAQEPERAPETPGPRGFRLGAMTLTSVKAKEIPASSTLPFSAPLVPPEPPATPPVSGVLPFSAVPAQEAFVPPATPPVSGALPFSAVPAQEAFVPRVTPVPVAPPQEEWQSPPEFGGVPGLDPGDLHAAPETLGRPAPPLEDEATADQQAAPAPQPDIEAPLRLEDYPPARCGAIAARLALDEAATADLLRAEKLDPEKWEKVHEHWLDRIEADVARSRTGSREEYDTAYVEAIEADRGTLTPETYAALAEAAERDAVEEELAIRKLPEEAWAPIHRVWLKRLIQDEKKAREVRAAVTAIRAALP